MKIAPSILNADFLNLETVLKKLNESDYLHLDVMDGDFVPNISFGPDISYQISLGTNVPLDIHLMISNPATYISQFAKSKPEFITVHFEANNYMDAIKLIKENNIKVGVSIKPQTSVNALTELLPTVDLVLVMSVEPGFGGQKFMTESLDKIKQLNAIRQTNGYHYVIEVDGGIDQNTAKLVKDAGVDIAVVGSYLMKQDDYTKTIKELR